MACAMCGYDPGLAVTGHWGFHVPLEPPSQNEVSGNKGRGRGSRYKYMRARDAFAQWFQVRKAELGIPGHGGRKRRVTLTRRYRQHRGHGRPRDRGNLIGGCKPALDALIIAGLIEDDRPECCEDHYLQRRSGPTEEPGLLVLIEDVKWPG